MSKADKLMWDVMAGIQARTEQNLAAVMTAAAALGALKTANYAQKVIRFTVSTADLEAMYARYDVTQEFNLDKNEWTIHIEEKSLVEQTRQRIRDKAQERNDKE